MSRRPDPYGSALDLPSVAETLEQIRGGKLLTRVIARHLRPELIRLERSVRELAAVVDEFYGVLGDRHWIFHDNLNVERIRAILRLDAGQIERALIAMYMEPETLEFLIRMLRRFPGMRARAHLIERAEKDFLEGRYYSIVLVLLAVMDGFVNEVESEHRGLHTRDADEMHAWDSVVGHHLGLARAHRTFTKTFSVTSSEEVRELYRNGIMHGILLNFDNEFVAAKAWNRLFAVADWATSRQKESNPTESRPTFRELVGRIRENEEAKKALAGWQPRVVSDQDSGFIDDPLRALVVSYLDAWKARNYGQMASALAPLGTRGAHGQTAGMVRAEHEGYELTDFAVHRLSSEAAAACEVDVDLMLDGDVRPARMRWIRERADGEVAFPNQTGEWKLIAWGPLAIIHRAKRGETEDLREPVGSGLHR